MNVYTSNGRTFYNSDTIICQYYDIIKSPWFTLLNALNQIDDLKDSFDFSNIEYLDTAGLYEWYVYRRNRNFFVDLAGNPKDEDSINKLDTLLNHFMREDYYFYSENTTLNFFYTMQNILSYKELVNNIIIYEKYVNDNMMMDVDNLFNGKIKVVSGDFNDLLTKIGTDNTFILSDINLIKDIKDNEKLNYSSILVPDKYGYIVDINNEYRIDIQSLYDSHTFKFDMFNNIYQDIDIK